MDLFRGDAVTLLESGDRLLAFLSKASLHLGILLTAQLRLDLADALSAPRLILQHALGPPDQSSPSLYAIGASDATPQMHQWLLISVIWEQKGSRSHSSLISSARLGHRPLVALPPSWIWHAPFLNASHGQRHRCHRRTGAGRPAVRGSAGWGMYGQSRSGEAAGCTGYPRARRQAGDSPEPSIAAE